MNKTKIEWADYTWNPVTGCLHGCDYCYARRIANRFSGGKAFPNGFEPTFRPERMNRPSKTKEPSRVFVCSMADLFGEWVPDEWITEVFKACEAAPQHQYLFLTKNPDRYCDLYDYSELPRGKNFWYGSTITKSNDNLAFDKSPTKPDNNYFLSIEPLLGEVTIDLYYLKRIKWVIVGAQTGPGAVKPKPEWVQEIIDQARAANVPLFLKDNLKWPEKIQEFPAKEVER